MLFKRRKIAKMAEDRRDPRRVRVSDHFVLSDFLGCHSVYSRGLKNPFATDDSSARKLANLQALCQHGLERLLAQFGPISISYGYISPEVSREIVKYQDPDKPSHHRFDLGAAADICVHRWVSGDVHTILDLYAPQSILGAPIGMAFAIDYLEIPYSRLITYSESPYLCLAISADEVASGKPRKAFYENRYTGQPRVKPDYRQYVTHKARQQALEELQNTGLEHDWKGVGFPTYHGGGGRKLQHVRVSKYTMLTDWLFDLKSITNGERNLPLMSNRFILDSFAAAGTVYDWLIDSSEVPRLPIVSGYVSHVNQYLDKDNDWRGDRISFLINPGAPFCEPEVPKPGVDFDQFDGFIKVSVEVDTVLNWR